MKFPPAVPEANTGAPWLMIGMGVTEAIALPQKARSRRNGRQKLKNREDEKRDGAMMFEVRAFIGDTAVRPVARMVLARGAPNYFFFENAAQYPLENCEGCIGKKSGSALA